ncbi:MAG: DUF4350 domain-containing protein [Acidobacteriota bacterium]|nr:DUF4350 domain-containing protein [Acidobacteriota bacterium]
MRLLFFFLLTPLLFGQQVADRGYTPKVDNPAWPEQNGPVILIDEAHNNFHTMDGRYKPFADVMRADGFRVKANRAPFTEKTLAEGDILVISNALNKRNVEDWSLPTPSAFSAAEIKAVRAWVENGGSLLFMVDHMPMPGCAQDLARAFGLSFSNGFAGKPGEKGPLLFTTKAGTLRPHPILKGRNAQERVNSVATFTGSAFRADASVEIDPLFVFPRGWISFETVDAWEFKNDTPKVPVEGWYQGATLKVGKGRVAVFGEAAMFTAQTHGKRKFGLADPKAKQNLTFLLNVAHWLAGILEP